MELGIGEKETERREKSRSGWHQAGMNEHLSKIVTLL